MTNFSQKKTIDKGWTYDDPDKYFEGILMTILNDHMYLISYIRKENLLRPKITLKR